MITAIVFVEAEVARIPEVAAQIADLDGVSEVYSVTGGIDLIAMIRVRSIDEVAEVIAFLVSDPAAAVHGAVYLTDNGKTAG